MEFVIIFVDNGTRPGIKAQGFSNPVLMSDDFIIHRWQAEVLVSRWKLIKRGPGL